MKMIRIDDEQYSRLEYIAAKEGRSATGHLKVILAREFDIDIEPKKEILHKQVHIDEAIQSISTIPTNNRTVAMVLAEINSMKSKMNEELEYCQDQEEIAKIKQKYDVQPLWDEFKSLKG
jgi:hypothetical protein